MANYDHVLSDYCDALQDFVSWLGESSRDMYAAAFAAIGRLESVSVALRRISDRLIYGECIVMWDEALADDCCGWRIDKLASSLDFASIRTDSDLVNALRCISARCDELSTRHQAANMLRGVSLDKVLNQAECALDAVMALDGYTVDCQVKMKGGDK